MDSMDYISEEQGAFIARVPHPEGGFYRKRTFSMKGQTNTKARKLAQAYVNQCMTEGASKELIQASYRLSKRQLAQAKALFKLTEHEFNISTYPILALCHDHNLSKRNIADLLCIEYRDIAIQIYRLTKKGWLTEIDSKQVSSKDMPVSAKTGKAYTLSNDGIGLVESFKVAMSSNGAIKPMKSRKFYSDLYALVKPIDMRMAGFLFLVLVRNGVSNPTQMSEILKRFGARKSDPYQALELLGMKDLVSIDRPGPKVVRYQITAAGKQLYRKMVNF